MFNEQTDRSRLKPVDLARLKEALQIKQLVRIAGELHARGVSTSCGLSEEERRQTSNKLQERLSILSRREAIQFLRDEEHRYADFLTRNGNPGAHESQLAIETRRLHLIGSVLRELTRQGEDEVSGFLVVVAVDAYLGLSDFGIDRMNIAKEIFQSTE